MSYETILCQLCDALGWQGGTIHDALAEVKRQRLELAESKKAMKAATAEIQRLAIRFGQSKQRLEKIYNELSPNNRTDDNACHGKYHTGDD